MRGFRVFHKTIISSNQGSPTRGPPGSLTRPAATFVNVRVCMYVCVCMCIYIYNALIKHLISGRHVVFQMAQGIRRLNYKSLILSRV